MREEGVSIHGKPDLFLKESTIILQSPEVSKLDLLHVMVHFKYTVGKIQISAELFAKYFAKR